MITRNLEVVYLFGAVIGLITAGISQINFLAATGFVSVATLIFFNYGKEN